MATTRVLACLLGAAGIGTGAFGAHALKQRPDLTPANLKTWETAVHYHLFGALAILAAGTDDSAAAWTMFAGTLLFSGSLYALVLTGIRKLGIITPIGGTVMIVAWLLYAFQD